ncbi:MAG TPA: hypothetical protein VLA64_06275, partial [Azonexus sp.]|nr:hypothetical protein [Azonexus sp.]
TAREGGDSLRHAATTAIQEQLKPSISGAHREALRLPVLLSCRADFPNEWARAIPGVNLEIPITRDLLPYWMEAVRIGSGNSARKLSVCQVLVGDLLKAPPATPRFITVWPPDPPPSVPPEWPENPLNSGSLPNNVADRFILLGVGLQ